jgi:aromatic-L-amino-acid/L-tryptophan decarboxylase
MTATRAGGGPAEPFGGPTEPLRSPAAEPGGVVVGPRRAPLAMDPETFRSVAHELVDRLGDLLGTLRDRPVTPGESPQDVRALLGDATAMPERGVDVAALVGSATELLFQHSLFNGHPRFLGYITSSPAPIGMLGEFLAGAVNANVGAWVLSPMATEIEAQTVRWIAQLIGYPDDCGGLLVSGGNMANFVGFFAARAAMADWDVRRLGVAGAAARPLRVYASGETHTWIHKAADLAGIGTDAIRWIPTDDDLRMDVGGLAAALREDREAGFRPMMVVGTAGSVSTGAVDPLHDIARVCRDAGVWFHVDGAYGGFAAIVPDGPRDLQAISLADSVAVDPHKWLYAPLEAGCALVRDATLLRAAFAYHPPYYHFGIEATNYVDYGMQNSRGFRALKVWLALRSVGRQGYETMIAQDIGLSRRLHARVAAHPELQAMTQALSITTFRYVPLDLQAGTGTEAVETYLNDLNEKLLERVQGSGEAFVSNAVIRGRFALRACIVNFNTDAADVDELPGIIARLGREVDAALRP